MCIYIYTNMYVILYIHIYTYVCILISLSLYIYIYTYIYIYIHVCIYIYIDVCIQGLADLLPRETYIHVHMFISLSLSLCVYIYIYVHIDIYIYIYIYLCPRCLVGAKSTVCEINTTLQFPRLLHIVRPKDGLTLHYYYYCCYYYYMLSLHILQYCISRSRIAKGPSHWEPARATKKAGSSAELKQESCPSRVFLKVQLVKVQSNPHMSDLDDTWRALGEC